MDKYDRIDELLEKPHYIVDFLPERVPADSAGQYFTIEEYFYQKEEIETLNKKWSNILLKLNCYYDFDVHFHQAWQKNPEPKKLAKWIDECVQGEKEDMNILLDEEKSMIIVNGNNLHIIFCNPDDKLSALVSQLAIAEGLFYWKASD